MFVCTCLHSTLSSQPRPPVDEMDVLPKYATRYTPGDGCAQELGGVEGRELICNEMEKVADQKADLEKQGKPRLKKGVEDTSDKIFTHTPRHRRLMDWPLVEKPSPPAPRYCGGLPLQEGYCLVPATGTFEEINFDELPEAMQLREKAAHTGKPKETPWCAEGNVKNDGRFVSAQTKGNPYNNDKFVGREGEFHLFSCRTLPLNHRNLVRAFGGKRLLMIGDGHVRNLLSALVAGVRGERFFVDPHGVHEGLHYSFGHKADLWRQVNLASFPGLTPTTSRAGTASPRNGTGSGFVGCEEHWEQLGLPCVDVFFAWAPRFRERPAGGDQAPDDGHQAAGGAGRGEPLGAAHSGAALLAADVDEIFRSDVFELDAFTVALWPHDVAVAERRAATTRRWLHKEPRKFRVNVMDAGLVTDKIESEQILHTRHDVCGMMRSFASDRVVGIDAHEACTGPVSRALVRLWTTLSMPLRQENGQMKPDIPKAEFVNFPQAKRDAASNG
eukprot:CAMPEP_0114259906 /NCGR_PEP_ID=MMETSP0058-20121206/20158_1 /TAXON_ID=36894 /ORGANISM="Pyramimonas parkeae, CCMP726" /LENGTH=499 /DNA_ID=CAMNT_0001375015 /DNA_START=44 /DNA_END=1541 /DNA_ORIENTATION=+